MDWLLEVAWGWFLLLYVAVSAVAFGLSAGLYKAAQWWATRGLPPVPDRLDPMAWYAFEVARCQHREAVLASRRERAIAATIADLLSLGLLVGSSARQPEGRYIERDAELVARVWHELDELERSVLEAFAEPALAIDVMSGEVGRVHRVLESQCSDACDALLAALEPRSLLVFRLSTAALLVPVTALGLPRFVVDLWRGNSDSASLLFFLVPIAVIAVGSMVAAFEGQEGTVYWRELRRTMWYQHLHQARRELEERMSAPSAQRQLDAPLRQLVLLSGQTVLARSRFESLFQSWRPYQPAASKAEAQRTAGDDGTG